MALVETKNAWQNTRCLHCGLDEHRGEIYLVHCVMSFPEEHYLAYTAYQVYFPCPRLSNAACERFKALRNHSYWNIQAQTQTMWISPVVKKEQFEKKIAALRVNF